MVKHAVLIILAARVALLETAGAACVAVAAGLQFGTPAVLAWTGGCLLVKSFELDVRGGST